MEHISNCFNCVEFKMQIVTMEDSVFSFNPWGFVSNNSFETYIIQENKLPIRNTKHLAEISDPVDFFSCSFHVKKCACSSFHDLNLCCGCGLRMWIIWPKGGFWVFPSIYTNWNIEKFIVHYNTLPTPCNCSELPLVWELQFWLLIPPMIISVPRGR